MTGDAVWTIAQGGTAGLIAALLFALVGAARGWWVPGYLYRAVESKLARYEELAFKAMELAERATGKG